MKRIFAIFTLLLVCSCGRNIVVDHGNFTVLSTDSIDHKNFSIKSISKQNVSSFDGVEEKYYFIIPVTDENNIANPDISFAVKKLLKQNDADMILNANIISINKQFRIPVFYSHFRIGWEVTGDAVNTKK